MAARINKPASLLVLPLLCFSANALYGQADSLGSDFIAFVNGTNVAIPTFDGTIVVDPLYSGNTVIRLEYGSWSFQAFRFTPQDIGVDMTSNRDRGDVLHVKLRSDPSNAGKSGISIMFEDKASNIGDSPDADNPFRLTWFVPNAYHDGLWHDLTIPLPPATYDELEAAKTDSTIDELGQYWVYSGSWAGFAIALDLLGPYTAQRPDLWREFQWDGVGAFGIFWDNNQGGGPIWLDDVYIGSAGLDLSSAAEPVGAVTSASFVAGEGVNVISWDEVDGAGGYLISLSENPITVRDAPGVSVIKRVPVGAGTYEHEYQIPHSSLAPLTLYYGVSSLSLFGVENTEVNGGSITNETLPIQPYIIQLLPEEADILSASLEEGHASGEGFPEGLAPFVINEDHWFLADADALPDDNDDLSAEVWLGYTAENELFIYAEVQDDAAFFGTEAEAPNGGADTWQWDAFEIAFGNYDVRDIDGGGILVGSPHQSFQRGEEPDYQIRMAALVDGEGALVSNMHVAPDPGTGSALNKDNPPGSGMVLELINSTGKSQATNGYKILALVPLNAIQFEGTNDVVLDPPTGTQLRLIPFSLAFNDNDGSGRESQVGWSPRTTGSWWHTPAEWNTTAVAGRGLAPAVSAKVYLEGAYVAGSDSLTKAVSLSLPLVQPYGEAPFLGTDLEYGSPESVVSIPSNVVDWLVVQLRSGDPGVPPMTTVATRVAFLRSDGMIVGLDGVSPLSIFSASPGGHYLVVRHRNHASVMSADTLDLSDGFGSWDFTTSMAQAYSAGGNPMKDLGDGNFGMFACDANADGYVTVPDFNLWNAATLAGASGYEQADCNMDGFVTVPDFNLWYANTAVGASSKVPD